MARLPQTTDYRVNVEGVGDFVFSTRSMRDEIKIQREFAEMIDGVKPTEWLQAVCGWLADLRVLTVKSPEDWDLDDLDPLDPETYAKLGRVHTAFLEKERSFRSPKGASDKAAGAGTVPGN